MRDALAHWNDRALLGSIAGTRDRIAVDLERHVIRRHTSQFMRVLDVGCGTGETLDWLAGQMFIQGSGIDFSPLMVQRARARPRGVRHTFNCLDLRQDLSALGRFDLIYTQRCLINLPTWEEQAQAIRRLCGLLRRNGSLLIVENSQTGLNALNGLRQRWGLPTITPPWHNTYLDDEKVVALNIDGCGLVDTAVDYSSTYYFLSRVVNAKWAARNGREPAYDAWINRLARYLPAIGSVGQGKYWRWRLVE